MFRTRPLITAASLGACLGLAACGGKGAHGSSTGSSTTTTTTTTTTAGSGSGSASGSATTPDTTPAPDPKAVNVSLADVGLEADSMDRTADPCDDFYQFACGGWLAKNDIPDDRARYARFTEVTDRNEAALHDILEDASAGKGGKDPLLTKLGDFYGSCMDEKGIEKAGLSGIKPMLDKIKKVKDAKSLMATVTALHAAGINPIFDATGQPDNADSSKDVLWIDSGGLGLPDRDYYFKKDFADKVTAYHDHVAKVFTLLGKKDAAATKAADDIVALETKLADATETLVERRDPKSQYNPTKLADMAKLTPTIDWKAYLKGRGNDKLDMIVVANPKFFTAVDGLLSSIKSDVWQEYLTFHVVDAMSFGLPKAYDDEQFAFQQKLTGVEKQRDRWKRCVDAVGGSMPEALAVPYIAKMFPGESKQKAVETVASIAKAFDDNLSTVDWMSDTTKAAARSKLAKIQGMIGYPDKPREYTFKVSRKNLAANLLGAAGFEAHRQYMKAGKPVDRSEWLMPAFIVNAYYEPETNTTALPAGILQPPFWGKDRGVAANAGGIGMVVGHELTHGFDDQGAQFDEDGNLKMWWQPADFEKFKQRGQCIADQYSTFEVLPGKNVNGQLTLGEDIADNGGIKLAFHAYRSLRKDADKHYVADGFTEDQQFFLGVGQAWCSKDRPTEAERRLAVDPHAPPKFRVYGALVNDPDFATAFNCKPGSKMRPAKTCSVW